MTGVGSSPALATCETSHVLLGGVSGGFPGLLPFRPTFRLARLEKSEIIYAVSHKVSEGSLLRVVLEEPESLRLNKDEHLKLTVT